MVRNNAAVVTEASHVKDDFSELSDDRCVRSGGRSHNGDVSIDELIEATVDELL